MTDIQVTPNVVLANPLVRKTLNWVVGLAAILVPLLTIIDARSEAFDITWFTDPATAGTSFVAGLLGLVVTVPNIPSKKDVIPVSTIESVPPTPFDTGHGAYG